MIQVIKLKILARLIEYLAGKRYSIICNVKVTEVTYPKENELILINVGKGNVDNGTITTD